MLIAHTIGENDFKYICIPYLSEIPHPVVMEIHSLTIK